MEASDISVDVEDSDVEVCVIDDDEEGIGLHSSSVANSERPDIRVRPNDNNAGSADNGEPPSKILSADRSALFSGQPEMLHNYAKVEVKIEESNDEGKNLVGNGWANLIVLVLLSANNSTWACETSIGVATLQQCKNLTKSTFVRQNSTNLN